MAKNIYTRLRYVQQNLHAPKGQRNNFGNYNYRSCEDILEAVKAPLNEMECVILLSDQIKMIGERIYVEATATFVSENSDGADAEFVAATAFARESLTKKGMDESQITGAASSYARKYALNGLLLIDDNKDADTGVQHAEVKGGASSKPAPRSKPKPTPKPTPTPAPAPAPAPKPAASSAGASVLIEEKTRQAIINAFDVIGVEIWDLEKLYGAPETWTKADHKAMLAAYATIKNDSINYTVKDFLNGRQEVMAP